MLKKKETFITVLLLLTVLIFIGGFGGISADNTVSEKEIVDIEGKGTEDDPFIIYTFQGLEKIGTKGYPLDAYYKLGNDIDASPTKDKNYNDGKGWKPIGEIYDLGNKQWDAFQGVFDGQEYTIKNLYINRENDLIGLFAIVDEGVIKNLRILNIDVKGINEVGGLVGYNHHGTIINSQVTGSKGIVKGKVHVGGLVGYNEKGTIKNSFTTGDIKGKYYSIGGLIGYNKKGRIENCYTEAKIRGLEQVGGLIGTNYETIEKSHVNMYSNLDEILRRKILSSMKRELGRIYDIDAFSLEDSQKVIVFIQDGTTAIKGIYLFNEENSPQLEKIEEGEPTVCYYLKDKSNNTFILYGSYFLRRGLYHLWYGLVNLKNGETNSLYGGYRDAEYGGIGIGPEDKGIISMSYKLEDVNDDGYQDLVIEMVEEVKIGINIYNKIERIEYAKIYLATEDGFVEMNEDIIGSGTEENPFIIYTLEGLKKIGNKGYSLNAHYKLGGELGENYLKYREEIFTALDLSGGLEDNFEKSFSGKIGGYGVKMYLKRDGDKLRGYYYYTKNKEKIKLEGTISRPIFEMEEFVDGKKTGFFIGEFKTKDQIIGNCYFENEDEKFEFKFELYNDELIMAARAGEVEKIKKLVESGIDVNAKNDLGNTALIEAAKEGYPEVVKILLEAGADVGVRNDQQWAALVEATKKGYPEIVKLLLDSGADVNFKYAGKKALIYAVDSGNAEVVKLLLEAGANINDDSGWTVLTWAAYKGYPKMVEVLLKAGADVSITNDRGWSPLICAVRGGNAEVAKQLLEAGADISITNDRGWTPLICAASRGDAEVVKLLLEARANVNVTDDSGWTALTWAANKGHSEVVKLLLEAGADVNVTDDSGWTALICAAREEHSEVVKQLLEAGANVDVTNDRGWSPLICAASEDNAEIAKLLLDKGADVNITDDSDCTALIYAVRGGNVELVKQLLDKGADVDIADDMGGTALMYAAGEGNVEIVKLLVEVGAILDAEDEGFWALIYASYRGNLKVVEMLIEAGVNVNASTDNGQVTALMIAAEENHPHITKLLIDAGADLGAEDTDGLTALDYAKSNHSHEVIKILQDAGVKE